MAIVARLLRGEPLELVARETNVSIARLTEWRDRALAGAATALKEREPKPRTLWNAEGGTNQKAGILNTRVGLTCNREQ